jgi:hypothetical protein
MRARETALTGEVDDIVNQFGGDTFIGADDRDSGLGVGNENLHDDNFLSSVRVFPQLLYTVYTRQPKLSIGFEKFSLLN